VGEKGIPLKTMRYSATPPVTETPSGIVQERDSVEFSPGTTGSGRRDAVPNLKMDVPEEQSRTVLALEARTKAPRNLIIF
jgi:hypothetical protein